MDRLISEKKAIEAINDYWGEMETPTIDGYINAIKAVPSAEPTVAQERYEDLCEYFGSAKDILNNREDFKAWLERIKWHIHKAEELYEKYEQEPKTGHWIRELIRNEKGGCIGAKMICSECDNDNKHDEYMNYCPNCGCRMVESQKGANE